MFAVLMTDTRNGSEGFYTGRTGPHWTSAIGECAFPYETRAEAKRRATMIDRYSSLHGFSARVVPCPYIGI